MNDKHTWSNCDDDDVILIEKDTFKVSRLKELINTDITNKFNYQIANPRKTLIETLSTILVGQDNFQTNEIQIHSIRACQILRIDGKGWQKGNLKILVNQIIVDNNLKVFLEFSADKSNEPESPLDDIRQIMKS